jgi:hypothetical protein
LELLRSEAGDKEVWYGKYTNIHFLNNILKLRELSTRIPTKETDQFLFIVSSGTYIQRNKVPETEFCSRKWNGCLNSLCGVRVKNDHEKKLLVAYITAVC